MANRRPQNGGRRMDFGRNDRGKNFGRSGVSPWQGAGPGGGLPNLLPLAGGSTEATLALASNIINLLQPRQNPVPSLLDMPIRRDFGPNLGRYDRGYGPNRMGNQGNFRRTGNYNRAGERINTNRKPFKPNDGQRQQNKSNQKKDADSKANPVKSDEEKKDQEGEGETKEEESKTEAPKTRYDDIHPQLLKCHICNKSMWDGRSFENHLSGRAHAIMMQKTAESYALTADTMRQEFKIREMKRTRKIGQQPARDFYCAMCDMYAADGAIHRTTVGHRKLKKYLHPTCTSCHKEMPTRIELDEHRLTAEHLRNMQDKQETVSKPKPEVMVISTLSMEQMYVRDDRQRRRTEHKEEKRDADPNVKEENQDADKEESTDVKKDKEDDAKQEGETKKADGDMDDTLLDYNDGDDITGVNTERFPSYSTERGVGRSFLSEFRCVQCRLCRKLLDDAETAEVHLRTWRHHQLFVRMLAEKAGHKDKQEVGTKRSHSNDDGGCWKRRKTTPEEEDCDTNGHEAVAIKEEAREPEAEADADAEADGEGEMDMPPADELEDWEQSVDEILRDEKDPNESGNSEPTEEPEQVAEQPAEVETPVPEAQTPQKPQEDKPRPRASPRGRGRGRRRY